MKVIIYNELSIVDRKQYSTQLQYLLIDYFKERHTKVKQDPLYASMMIDQLLELGYLIYLVIDDEDKVLGFTIVSINNQWGMLEDSYVVCDYMYIIPKYRGSRVTRLLFITVGKLAMDYGYDVLGSTMIGSSNIHNTELVGGEIIANLVLMTRDSFKDKFKKYMKGYK